MGGKNVVRNGTGDEHDVSQEGHLDLSTPKAARIILVRDSVGLALDFEDLWSDTSRGLLTQRKTSLAEVCLSICNSKDKAYLIKIAVCLAPSPVSLVPLDTNFRRLTRNIITSRLLKLTMIPCVNRR